METVEKERWRYTMNFLKDVLKVSCEQRYDYYEGCRLGVPVFGFFWRGLTWSLKVGRTSSVIGSFETWTLEFRGVPDIAPDWVVQADQAFEDLLKTRKRGQ